MVLPVTDPLSGCWAKIDRAEAHISALRAEIERISGEDLHAVPLTRKYEPEHGAVVYRIERAPEVRESWGLVVGDALHNIRGALDYLWWQLATLHLGREPTEDEAKDVQFPIYTKPGDWSKRRFLKYVPRSLVDKIEPFQPYNAPPGQVQALEGLVTLSNIDKHRLVHAVARPAATGHFRTILGPYDFHNCAPTPGFHIDAMDLGDRPLKAGDPVFRAFVTPTGPNPDVNIDASLTAHIAIHAHWDLLPSLDEMLKEARRYVLYFSPFLEGPSMGHA